MKIHYDIIFLGLAKNVIKTIDKFLNSIEKLSLKNFKILLIIGENSSTDGSRNYLTKLKNKNYEFIFLETDFLKKYKNRILRLTAGREYLKNYINENKISSDFITIVDLDEVISQGINVDQYINAINLLKINKNKYFGISAKSKPYYYDLLPLIIKDYFEFDIYDIQTEINIINAFTTRKKHIYDFQKKITNMRDVDTVSSHNGLTIYFYKDYLLGNYVNNKTKKINSEHINLNQEINQKTNKFILMSNNLILNTPEEHMPLNFKQFVIKFFRKFTK